MRLVICRLVFALLILKVGLFGQLVWAQDEGDAAVNAMKAALEQWLQDIEFTCQYNYRFGVADSIESGLSGDWISADETKAFKGQLSKASGLSRMSIVYDAPPVLVGKTDDRAEYTKISVDEVSSTSIGLRYTPSLDGEKDKGLARLESRKRIETRGDGLSPYDAGSSTKRRLSPLSIDGNVIGSYLSANGNNSSKETVTLHESQTDHLVLRVSFLSGAFKVQKDVTITLQHQQPTVQEIRTIMDNEVGVKFESVARASDFVLLDSGPIATLVRNVTSSTGQVRVSEWRAVPGSMTNPASKDFLVPIAENAKVYGVRNPGKFMTNGMLDVTKVHPDDISIVYQDELQETSTIDEPKPSNRNWRYYFVGTLTLLFVGFIAWKSLSGKR